MFPVRSLALIVATTLATSVPLTAVANAAPAAQAQPQTVQSLPLGAEVTVNGWPWVMTVSGLEPVGAN